MPAYLILNYDVSDADALAAYRRLAEGVLVGRDGGDLLSSTAETVDLREGHEAGTHTVIIRFRDREHALRVYGSEGYQAVIGDRLAATTPRGAMIVDGLPG